MNVKVREDYWGEKPDIKNIQFRVLNEESQRINAIETKTVDISSVPNQDIDYANDLPGYNIQFYYGAQCTHVLFNVNEASIFHNLEARYAVAHAIDREAIARIVYNGYADVSDNPVSMHSQDYEPRFGNLNETYSKGYDLDLAKQYAESSGLAGKEISIMTNGAPEYVSMAEIIQANLKDIDVTAVINNYDQATLRATYRTDPTAYDLCLYFTGAPDNAFGSLFYRTVSSSAILTEEGAWIGLDRFMELAQLATVTADEKERKDIIYEMVQVFTKACPFFGVCDLSNATAFSSELGNVEIWALGSVRYQELSFVR
jgi:peptide/nickel transport system substrate-binding protein